MGKFRDESFSSPKSMKLSFCQTARIVLVGALCACGLFLCGCRPDLLLIGKNENLPLQDESFLLSGRISSMDTVTLEVFMVRCPFGDSELNTTLWKDVDEQILTPSLRKELAANGFRIGLIGNQLPASFLRILKTRDDEAPGTIVTTIRLDEMNESNHLKRKAICCRNGQRNEVNVSEVKPRATILFNENGALGGETFHSSQGVLAVRTQTEGDGSVTLDFQPEVQYGQPRQTFTYDTGSVMMATARPKRSFDTLRCELNVRPGQFVILTCRPDTSGNVGSFFFTNEDGENGMEQKLLCFRVLQTQHNEMYTKDGTLPMDPKHIEEEPAKAEKDAKLED